jgi:hypothetical protein
MFVNRQKGLGKFLLLVPAMSNGSGRKPLSFHAVSFGEYFSTTSLRRMADVALEIQNSPAHDVLRPAAPTVPSSFTTALDTVSNHASGKDMVTNPSQVRLTETFLGIAESLRKQRGSLMH